MNIKELGAPYAREGGYILFVFVYIYLSSTYSVKLPNYSSTNIDRSVHINRAWPAYI